MVAGICWNDTLFINRKKAPVAASISGWRATDPPRHSNNYINAWYGSETIISYVDAEEQLGQV